MAQSAGTSLLLASPKLTGVILADPKPLARLTQAIEIKRYGRSVKEPINHGERPKQQPLLHSITLPPSLSVGCSSRGWSLQLCVKENALKENANCDAISKVSPHDGSARQGLSNRACQHRRVALAVLWPLKHAISLERRYKRTH